MTYLLLLDLLHTNLYSCINADSTLFISREHDTNTRRSRDTRVFRTLTCNFLMMPTVRMASEVPWEVQLLKQFCGSEISLEGVRRDNGA